MLSIEPAHGNEKSLETIDRLAAAWRDLAPRTEEMIAAQQSYDEDFLVRMAYNSNAIEGSTLSLIETEIIYEGEFVPGKPGRDQISARGLFEGADFLDRALDEERTLDKKLILDLHERCALDLQPRARGAYRNAPAIILAARTTPLAPHKIRPAMDDLVYEYGVLREGSHPLLAIAWFHAAFESIHPFADGNGRTGRLLMNFQLQKSGYPPIAIKVDHGLEYKAALEAWQVDDNPQPFIDLFLSCLEDELESRIEFLAQGERPQPATRPAEPRQTIRVLDLITADPSITAKALGAKLGVSERQAQRLLRQLREKECIAREGPNKTGHWVILKNDFGTL